MAVSVFKMVLKFVLVLLIIFIAGVLLSFRLEEHYRVLVRFFFKGVNYDGHFIISLAVSLVPLCIKKARKLSYVHNQKEQSRAIASKKPIKEY